MGGMNRNFDMPVDTRGKEIGTPVSYGNTMHVPPLEGPVAGDSPNECGSGEDANETGSDGDE